MFVTGEVIFKFLLSQIHLWALINGTHKNVGI